MAILASRKMKHLVFPVRSPPPSRTSGIVTLWPSCQRTSRLPKLPGSRMAALRLDHVLTSRQHLIFFFHRCMISMEGALGSRGANFGYRNPTRMEIPISSPADNRPLATQSFPILCSSTRRSRGGQPFFFSPERGRLVPDETRFPGYATGTRVPNKKWAGKVYCSA